MLFFKICIEFISIDFTDISQKIYASKYELLLIWKVKLLFFKCSIVNIILQKFWKYPNLTHLFISQNPNKLIKFKLRIIWKFS